MWVLSFSQHFYDPRSLTGFEEVTDEQRSLISGDINVSVHFLF